MGYAFSPALVTQEQASSILTRWLQILSRRPRCGAEACSNSSPMGTHGDICGAGTDVQHANVDSGSDSCIFRRVDAGICDRFSSATIRLGWGSCLRIVSGAFFIPAGTPLIFIGMPRSRSLPANTAWRSRDNTFSGVLTRGSQS